MRLKIIINYGIIKYYFICNLKYYVNIYTFVPIIIPVRKLPLNLER